MSNYCLNCGALLENMTCDRCPCALDYEVPPISPEANTGLIYRPLPEVAVLWSDLMLMVVKDIRAAQTEAAS